MLENHGNFRSGLAELCIVHIPQILPFYKNGTTRRLFQKIQASYKGALTRTTHTDYAAYISFPDIQIDSFQRLDYVVPPRERL